MQTETITDYITGKQIPATPEEVEARQPMLKKLVEELGYEKEQIKTEYGISKSPSDESGKYPVDIAVFEDNKKTKLKNDY